MSSRPLKPSELLDVGDKLAEVASDAGVSASDVAARLDVSAASLDLSGPAKAVWGRVARKVHAGASATAGYQADAVAGLIQALADEVPGHTELRDLAYGLGTGPSATMASSAGRQAIFLSYATPERTSVDALHDAIAARDPKVSIFQDHRSVSLGDDWLEEIRSSAGSASILACWVSTNFLDSPYCTYEVGIAEGTGAKIIPIFVEAHVKNKAPAYLTSRQGLMASSPPDFVALADEIVGALP